VTTATVEILQEAYDDNPTSARLIEDVTGMKRGHFSEALAAQWIKNHKQDHLAHDLGKGVRPWEIVNVSAKLDPKQPWFGVEYETGYANKTAYHKIVNYLWQHHPLTAIDHEGCGMYPCEITFAPVNMDTFMSKDYHMDRLLAFQKKNDAAHARHAANDQIGTHVNVSTPAYRKLDRNGTHDVTFLLAYLKIMSNEDYKRVYGRTPYGGFNPMADQRGNQWVEGKLFNSTGSTLVWAKYKQVMARISELIVDFSRLQAKGKLPPVFKTPKGVVVSRNDVNRGTSLNVDVIRASNMADFLLGEIEVKDLKFIYANYKRDGRFIYHG
jgi:hypothetical protein